MPAHSKMPTALRAAVQQYLKLGFDLHWLVPAVHGNRRSGKAPIDEGYNCRPKRKTLGELAAAYRPGLNLGMTIGVNCDVAVLDVDGDVPAAEIKKLFGGRVPRPNVTTGSGGAHYWVRWIGKLPGTTTLWKGDGDHQALEFLGRGKNVVLPPSSHWSGGNYALSHPRIVNASPALIARLHVQKRAPRRGPSTDTLDGAARLLRAIDNSGTGVEWQHYNDVMLALQNTFGDDALDLFLDWASHSDRYDERYSLEEWHGWGKKQPDNHKTMATLQRLSDAYRAQSLRAAAARIRAEWSRK